MTIKGAAVALAVDHCHTKGTVRGLLCTKCNQGLGCFKHDTALLRTAVEYLQLSEALSASASAGV